MSILSFTQATEDYQRIEKAITFLEANFQQQPDLKTIADAVGLSEYHFQRLFSRWAGISPKRFLQFLTLEHAKTHLTQADNLLDTSFQVGLSGPGRLHDLFITYEAMTPGEYKKQAAGLTIRYGFHPTPFGECLLAVTDRGLCGLEFVHAANSAALLTDLQARWQQAHFQRDQAGTQPLVETIFGNAGGKINLLLKGTPFQLKVWQALLKIPAGALVSYHDVATLIKQPEASRAVGTAIGRNPVGYLIPCHRVIRKMGVIGPYHWGESRKKALIGWEAARAAVDVPVAV
jgi:AraC family transcriptional regulator of adaptative response/methylated-DNA-[protein]-cysteine methyltransferase